MENEKIEKISLDIVMNAIFSGCVIYSYSRLQV